MRFTTVIRTLAGGTTAAERIVAQRRRRTVHDQRVVSSPAVAYALKVSNEITLAVEAIHVQV